MVRRVLFSSPECLGQMAQRYCRHCSERCPVTALCVLLLMGEYLRHDVRKSSYSEEAAEPLTAYSDEP
ncbi:MAG: hypothetical protein FJ004_11820 [Chloroflexi bacterium]|nr:hypothetical protein [Chloroflexota bacterium]